MASDSLGVEQALMVAWRELKEMFVEGWPVGRTNGQHAQPMQVFVDSGYMSEVVYAFCRESGARFRPAVGRGASQQHRQWYNRPTQTGSIVKCIGEGYHANWLPAENLYLVEIDADHWKTWVHQRLSSPLDKPGAMTLFQAQPNEHLSLAKHLTAEAKTEEYVAGKGTVTKWERIRRQNHWFDALSSWACSSWSSGKRIRRQNHWFDALYYACAAGHGCGVRLVDEQVPLRPPSQPNPTPSISASEWMHPDEVRGWLGPKRW